MAGGRSRTPTRRAIQTIVSVQKEAGADGGRNHPTTGYARATVLKNARTTGPHPPPRGSAGRIIEAGSGRVTRGLGPTRRAGSASRPPGLRRRLIRRAAARVLSRVSTRRSGGRTMSIEQNKALARRYIED